MGKHVLVVGWEPTSIDFDSDFFRGKPLTAASIQAGLDADHARLLAAGYDVTWLYARYGGDPAAEAARLRDLLAARPADLVVVGGGVRLDPTATPMLEALVNAAASAGVRLGFNTTPNDTAAAVERGLADALVA
ncbi:hypothetical protein [Sphingomonas azotifigens]|uniref:hypothetical protein n=1 Tax=Sphingomonas azotifigens TaxID=330920 RepID=UPI000A04E09C|nr:hypothetical protein [Sphingomonas azotifigens]